MIIDPRSTPLDLPFDCPLYNITTWPMKMRLRWVIVIVMVILLTSTNRLCFYSQILFLNPKRIRNEITRHVPQLMTNRSYLILDTVNSQDADFRGWILCHPCALEGYAYMPHKFTLSIDGDENFIILV